MTQTSSVGGISKDVAKEGGRPDLHRPCRLLFIWLPMVLLFFARLSRAANAKTVNLNRKIQIKCLCDHTKYSRDHITNSFKSMLAISEAWKCDHESLDFQSKSAVCCVTSRSNFFLMRSG